MSALRGRVRSLYSNRNYGFIRCDGHDYFFHAGSFSPLSSVDFPDTEIGDVAEFEAIEHPKGMRAVNVRILAKDGDVVPPTLSEDDGE